jgi:hypothetical protein
MTLSNEDKALIKETSDLLKQLKPLLNKVEKFICEPIDTTEGEPIKTEQRWKPKYNKEYYYISLDNGIHTNRYVWKGYADDLNYFNTGNCFQTEQEAQKAAEAIKQYLSTNKF